MEQYLKGQGTILKDGATLYVGRYIIEISGPPMLGIITPGFRDPVLLKHPTEPIQVSGAFEATAVSVDKLTHDYGSGDLSGELTLVLEDGKQVSVRLALAQKDFDAGQGIARFGMSFAPGSEDILARPVEKKKKYFAQVIKR